MVLFRKGSRWECAVSVLHQRLKRLYVSACVHNVQENGSQADQQLLRYVFDELFLPD